MSKLFAGLFAIASAMSLTHLAHAGGPSTGMGYSQPSIESIELDASNSQIIISGSQFGSTPPIVNLGKSKLEVTQSNPNLITAKLPKDIRPATYRMDVISTDKVGNTSMFLNIPG